MGMKLARVIERAVASWLLLYLLFPFPFFLFRGFVYGMRLSSSGGRVTTFTGHRAYEKHRERDSRNQKKQGSLVNEDRRWMIQNSPASE